MTEILFIVEEAPEGGYTARASIFAEGETIGEIRTNVRDAVACHFEERAAPRLIRLHFVRDEVLTV